MADVIFNIQTLEGGGLSSQTMRNVRPVWQVAAGSNAWCPPTDVIERERDFLVLVEVAGMQGGKFIITLDERTLVIQGERSSLNEPCSYHQMETGFGTFRTGVELSAPVEAEKVHANYEDGFLKIILPKPD